MELTALFRSVVGQMELLQQKAMSVSISAPPELPMLNGDRIHLTSVLYNLVENAVKYVPENLHIAFSAAVTDQWLQFELADNGEGIGQQYLPHLFDKFYRVPEGNRHSVKGFGLGLFYVRKIVEAHGGTIAVTSIAGSGTRFIIRLPLTA